MTVWKAIEEASERFASRPGLIRDGAVFTWSEVLPRVERLAGFFEGRGVGVGDRVAVLEWNSVEFFELTFALARLRAVMMPLNVRLDGESIARVLKDGGAEILVARADFAGLVRDTLENGAGVREVLWTGGPVPEGMEIPSVPWPDLTLEVRRPTLPHDESAGSALCHLYYTSGTTGQPKGVMLTHDNVWAHARAAVAELNLGPGDVWGHFAPMFHLADAWATVAVTLAGGCHSFLSRFTAERAAQVIDGHGVTITNMIPTMLGELTRYVEGTDGFAGGSLRMLLSGGAPISPDLVRRVTDVFGCEYVQTYGMTETSPYLTMSLLDDALRREPLGEQMRYRAKTGRPFRGVELRLVGEDGLDVPADGKSVGEIWARGASVSPGYWNNPELTRAARRDGWLCTGDLATVDGRGFFDIVDRKKDMIITGGENVYSTEVEHVLHAHPAVAEAAVVGLADEQWGERVHAVVALTHEGAASEAELAAHCRSRLPGFKAPKSFEFLRALPKTGSGKIHKAALRGR